jgi:hypothetical protein
MLQVTTHTDIPGSMFSTSHKALVRSTDNVTAHATAACMSARMLGCRGENSGVRSLNCWPAAQVSRPSHETNALKYARPAAVSQRTCASNLSSTHSSRAVCTKRSAKRRAP